eukprot:434235-Hanusia_phi.AAC.1
MGADPPEPTDDMILPPPRSSTQDPAHDTSRGSSPELGTRWKQRMPQLWRVTNEQAEFDYRDTDEAFIRKAGTLPRQSVGRGAALMSYNCHASSEAMKSRY